MKTNVPLASGRHDVPPTSGRRSFPFILSILLLLTTTILNADSLDQLAEQISALDRQIAAKQDQYNTEQKSNQLLLKRIEAARLKQDQNQVDRDLPQAYEAAEKLDRINADLNDLREQKASLCKRWEKSYGSTIDELLSQADQENDKDRKGSVGKKIQGYQEQGSRLCPKKSAASPVPEWQQLQVQPYDGPREIQQKVQLLRDISREIRLQRAQLETEYQDVVRNRKVKERAVEFVQERSLFNTPPTPARSPSAGSTTLGTQDPIKDDHGAPFEGSDSAAESQWNPEWPANPEKQDLHYRKMKEKLADQEKELQRKIHEFEKQARDLLQE